MLPSDFHQCWSVCEHPPIDFDLAQPLFISTCGLTYSTVPSRCSSVTLPKLLSYTHRNMQIHTKKKKKERWWLEIGPLLILPLWRGWEEMNVVLQQESVKKKPPPTWGGGGRHQRYHFLKGALCVPEEGCRRRRGGGGGVGGTATGVGWPSSYLILVHQLPFWSPHMGRKVFGVTEN